MNTEKRSEKGLPIGAIAVLLGVIVSWGCLGKANSPTTKDKEKSVAQSSKNNKRAVPNGLVDAGEFGENIYDAAKAGDWKTAEAKLNELKASVKKLDADKIGSEKLDSALIDLEKAVDAKDKNVTLKVSNKFTFDAAELTAKYNPAIPVEVTKLDFYGRELEIWAGEKNDAKLKQTTLEIRKTWDAVKPKIDAHDGSKQAAVFEDLVKKTEAAKSVSDYEKLATPILDEVDNLENDFK